MLYNKWMPIHIFLDLSICMLFERVIASMQLKEDSCVAKFIKKLSPRSTAMCVDAKTFLNYWICKKFKLQEVNYESHHVIAIWKLRNIMILFLRKDIASNLREKMLQQDIHVISVELYVWCIYLYGMRCVLHGNFQTL